MGDIVKQEGSAPSIPQYNLLDKQFHSALQVVDDVSFPLFRWTKR